MASVSKIAATDAKLQSIKPNANSSLRCCPYVTVSIQIFRVSLTKKLVLLSVETVFFPFAFSRPLYVINLYSLNESFLARMFLAMRKVNNLFSLLVKSVLHFF